MPKFHVYQPYKTGRANAKVTKEKAEVQEESSVTFAVAFVTFVFALVLDDPAVPTRQITPTLGLPTYIPPKSARRF